MKSYFVTELVVEQISDKLWKLKEPLIYYSELLNMEIIVPAGFETDFSSVPRVPFVFWWYGDRAHLESVLHDALYKNVIVSRKMADAIFLEAMKVRKKGWLVRNGMWLGVRLGGWYAWKKHRKND